MAQTKDTAGIENSYQETGLHDADIQTKRIQYGYNEIPEKTIGAVKGTLKRMWGPIPWLLEAAMLFELLLGKGVQAVVVFLLLVFSAVIGYFQENRAKKAIGYLHQQLQISVRNLRNGTWQTIPSRELVPGDIVHTRVGDIVPADMEIINGIVSVDESALTGESIDVTKEAGETIFSGGYCLHSWDSLAGSIAIFSDFVYCDDSNLNAFQLPRSQFVGGEKFSKRTRSRHRADRDSGSRQHECPARR